MSSKLCLISLLLMSAAAAEKVPVIAKITKTNQVVTRAGSQYAQVVPVSIREGMLYRATDGSTLRKFEDRAQLTRPGKSYEIDYRSQMILEVPAQGVEDYKGVNPLRESTVAAIRCKVIQIATDTEACVSVEYGLMLRQEKSYPGDYGTILHVVTELSEVKLHSEPDSNLFTLPEGFRRPINTEP